MATIVGQVDLKFIACLIPTRDYRYEQADSTLRNETALPGAPTLVLIDQHAADERIRVEAFLEELCLGFLNNLDGNADPVHRIELRTLTPPKPVLVTWHELRLLQESKEIPEAFRMWGIHLAGYSTPGSGTDCLAHEGDSRTFGQVLVEAIPEVISDKVMFCCAFKILVTHIVTEIPASARR
jgi:DNA mismatch repair protein MLH3